MAVVHEMHHRRTASSAMMAGMDMSATARRSAPARCSCCHLRRTGSSCVTCGRSSRWPRSSTSAARGEPAVRLPARPEPSDPRPGAARRLRPAAALHAPGGADAGRRRAARPGPPAAAPGWTTPSTRPARSAASWSAGWPRSGSRSTISPPPAPTCRSCATATSSCTRSSSWPPGVGAAGQHRRRAVPAGHDPGRSGADGLLLHGGGYVMGSAFGYRHLASALAAAAEAGVVVPEFRLAPEHPFPAGAGGRPAGVPLDARQRVPPETDRGRRRLGRRRAGAVAAAPPEPAGASPARRRHALLPRRRPHLRGRHRAARASRSRRSRSSSSAPSPPPTSAATPSTTTWSTPCSPISPACRRC